MKTKKVVHTATHSDYENQVVLNLRPKTMANAEKMSRMMQVKPKYREEARAFGKGKMSHTFEAQRGKQDSRQKM